MGSAAGNPAGAADRSVQSPGVKTLDVHAIGASLERFVREHYGTQARVARLAPMEAGHAGLTYGFEVASAGAAPVPLILKLAPPGVRRAGNTDVYRQAPLLRALHATGLPVPDVPWASPGEETFGTPFVMMERLPGRVFFLWDADPSFDPSPRTTASVWEHCVDALVALHAFDWRTHLPDWQAPQPLREQIEWWSPILMKAPEPRWIDLGQHARERLLATMPADTPVGLVHGDFQPGNALYVHEGAAGAGGSERLTGIIDWELSGIGPSLLDVGWLMFFTDARAWPEISRPTCVLEPEALAARYGAASGTRHATLPWFHALAAYRFGAISCLNVYLHRSGRRVDPFWERIAHAVPSMFTRAAELLA